MGETIFAPTAALHLWSNVSDFPGNVKFSMQIRLLAYDNGTLGIVVFLLHLFPVVSVHSVAFVSHSLLTRCSPGLFSCFAAVSRCFRDSPLPSRPSLLASGALARGKGGTSGQNFTPVLNSLCSNPLRCLRRFLVS